MKGLSRLLPIIGGAIAGGAIALAVASGSTTTHSVTTTTVVQPSNSPTLPTSFSNGHSQTINQIYRAVDPGVVDITTSSTQNTGGVFGFGQTQKTEGEGAGVVFDKKGDIITDEHVVSGASSITVNFPDGTKAPATLVGSDTGADTAVIRVQGVAASALHPIPFGDSSAVQVGDSVIAIGSPFGAAEHGHRRHRQRGRPHDQRAQPVHDPERDPDRRADQPRQLGRPAAQRRRPGDRAQRPDRDQQHQRPGRGLELGRRVRDPVEQRRADRP